MTYFHSPRIPTDGLVLALDAANTKSYTGSGTTWSDLSGNGNNGTLTNGPTFDSDNGGSLDFNGVGDYAKVSNLLDIIKQKIKINAIYYSMCYSMCYSMWHILTAKENVLLI